MQKPGLGPNARSQGGQQPPRAPASPGPAQRLPRPPPPLPGTLTGNSKRGLPQVGLLPTGATHVCRRWLSRTNSSSMGRALASSPGLGTCAAAWHAQQVASGSPRGHVQA